MTTQSPQAMSMQSPHVAPTEKPNVSYEDINFPATFITGGLIGTIVTICSVIWWVRGVKGDVDINKDRIGRIESEIEEREKKTIELFKVFKDDIRITIKSEIASSASDICHGFDLFGLEQRQNIKSLQEAITEKKNVLENAVKRIDYLEKEMQGLTLQLQRNNLDVHLRQFGDD